MKSLTDTALNVSFQLEGKAGQYCLPGFTDVAVSFECLWKLKIDLHVGPLTIGTWAVF